MKSVIASRFTNSAPLERIQTDPVGLASASLWAWPDSTISDSNIHPHSTMIAPSGLTKSSLSSSSMTTAAPFYTTAGKDVDLSSKPLPSSEEIYHPVPESYAQYAALRIDFKDFDVTIVVGDQKIEAHKALLSARVPFFRGLFDAPMTESAAGMVTLPNFTYPTAKALLDYIYTGKITIDESNVEDLLMGANFLHIELVERACGHFMVKRLQVANALPVYMICKSIGYHGIDDLVLRFIDKNFLSISHTPEFLTLSASELGALLQRDSINVEEETQVFDVVTRWMEEDGEKMKHAESLLLCVRCPRINEDKMDVVLAQTLWVAHSQECMELLEKAKEQRRNPSLKEPFETKERRCDEAHNLIFAVGLLSSVQNPSDSTMAFYEPIRDKWTECQKLPNTRGRNGVAVCGRKIYAIGGNDSKERLRTCEVYDTEKDQWTEAPTLNHVRAAMATGVIDGKIYVAGGYDGHNALDSMEILNPSDTQPAWTSVQQMSKLRGAPASCVLNGMLYVIGGHDGTQIHHDGEYFNPATKTWTSIAPMRHKRCRVSAAVIDGKIYVAGGFDGAAFLRDLEIYDPATNTWSDLKQMSERRNRSALAVSCGKLYVFGGFDGLNNVSTVEMYDPKTNTWTHRAEMIAHSGGIFVGCLPIPPSIASPVANLESDDIAAAS